MTFVSALIQDVAGPTGKVLICRKEGGAWQLPACKVFTSERPECAVARLAREQLGIGLKVGKLAMIGRHLRPETDASTTTMSTTRPSTCGRKLRNQTYTGR